MARFYAEIQGNRGSVTRTGSKNSGISGHIRGWDIGARVSCDVDDQGRDVVYVTLTGGSSGHSPSLCLGSFVKENGEYVKA